MIKQILVVLVFLCMTSISWAEYDYEVGDIYYTQDGEKYQVISIAPDKMQMKIEPYIEPLKSEQQLFYIPEYLRRLFQQKGWLK